MAGSASGTAASRRTPRRLYSRPVGILVGGHYEVMHAKQLSEGGMLVSTGRYKFQAGGGDASTETGIQAGELPIGKKLTVSMILPAGAVMILRGHVIYHDQSGSEKFPAFGVKFDSVTLNQRRQIRNYVSAKPLGETAV